MASCYSQDVDNPFREEIAPASLAATHTNTLAKVSLVAAILSLVANLVPFLGGIAVAIFAIVAGQMARRQIRQSGEGGWRLATAGMVIGCIHIALLALVGVAFTVMLIESAQAGST